MRRRATPRYELVGWLVAVAAVLVVYAAFTKQLPFASKYEIQAVVTSSNELRKGNPVRIAGVDVGNVTGISKGPGDTTMLELQISGEGRPVHRDARLTIRPRLFLEGGFTVALEPGSPSAPELEDGGVIPLSQTARPVQFDEILATFDTPTREDLKSTLAELRTGTEGGAAASLRQTALEAAPALRDLAVVAEAGRGERPRDLSRLVAGASRVTGALADREGELAPLVENLNRTAGALADHDTELAASVRELDPTLAAVPGALAAFERTLGPLRRFQAATRPSLPLVTPTLTRLRTFGRQLDAVAGSPAKPSEFPRLLVRLRPALRDIPKLSLLVRGLYPVVGPVVPCVRDNLAPTLNTKLDDGALSSGRPVWQDFLHGLVGLASSGQSFDANGLWMRYLFAADSASVPAPDPTGARPVWRGPGVAPPPYRPDAPCSDQAPPNLAARTGGPGAAARGAATDRPPGLADIRRVLRTAEGKR